MRAFSIDIDTVYGQSWERNVAIVNVTLNTFYVVQSHAISLLYSLAFLPASIIIDPCRLIICRAK